MEEQTPEEALLGSAWGALNFILAFYEPNQRYLDTEAWKQAEAGGRRVHKAIRDYLDEHKLPPFGEDLTVLDYEESFASQRKLVRELDVLLNGDGAAKQASLCDIVSQVQSEGIRSGSFK